MEGLWSFWLWGTTSVRIFAFFASLCLSGEKDVSVMTRVLRSRKRYSVEGGPGLRSDGLGRDRREELQSLVAEELERDNGAGGADADVTANLVGDLRNELGQDF